MQKESFCEIVYLLQVSEPVRENGANRAAGFSLVATLTLHSQGGGGDLPENP